MANSDSLTRFTEQGISKAKDTVQRAELAMQMAASWASKSRTSTGPWVLAT